MRAKPAHAVGITCNSAQSATANGSDEVARRAAVGLPGRPFIALASAESFKTTPIDGLTVLKQWSVRMTAGEHEIVVVLRKDGDTVIVDSVR